MLSFSISRNLPKIFYRFFKALFLFHLIYFFFYLYPLDSEQNGGHGGPGSGSTLRLRIQSTVVQDSLPVQLLHVPLFLAGFLWWRVQGPQPVHVRGSAVRFSICYFLFYLYLHLLSLNILWLVQYGFGNGIISVYFDSDCFISLLEKLFLNYQTEHVCFDILAWNHSYKSFFYFTPNVVDGLCWQVQQRRQKRLRSCCRPEQ